MIQKFYEDITVLTPDMIFSDRRIYSYEWYINESFVSGDYEARYHFEIAKPYIVKLIVTNINNKLSTICVKKISAILPSNCPGANCRDIIVSFNGGID